MADQTDHTDAKKDPEIRLWILRLLVPFGAYKQFVGEKEFNDDELARLLGLDDMLASEARERYDRQAAIGHLGEYWKEAEEQSLSGSPEGMDDKPGYRLGLALGLSETETDILRFRLTVARNRMLRKIMKWQGQLSLEELVDILSCCLKRAEADIRQSLSPDSTLVRSGIVELRPNQCYFFTDALDLLACISQEIHLAHDDPLAYFRSRIVKSAPPRLGEADYPHADRDLTVLRPYLAEALARHRPGVNVLIHGVPGSGKTELARMLAAALGVDLYEIAIAARNGSLLDGDQRFRAYRLGQQLLSRSGRHMILFDEIEDLFQEKDIGPMTGANHSQRKGAVNKVLESNPVPAFWITNNLDVIDRAFLRRFDYVLELNAPPRSVRGRILDEYLNGLPVSQDWKRRMAEHELLVPAVVARASDVVRAGGCGLPAQETERNLSRTLGNTLEAMGLPREPRFATPLGEGYRLDVLNADCDMAEVRAGLARRQRGRPCLYGPPGTGKTAFGRHLAETLDRPLMVRRASDIVSPWVGVTERNIARLFRESQEEEAVLLLDEADSFLRDRQGARQLWEVSAVNEMLAQMECFEGVFIASTNLMDSLDAAALRRFDLKIRFDYLKPEQARSLFLDLAQRLGIDVPTAIETRLVGLGCLTPGDFANVARQGKLRRIASACELLERLAAECAIKPESKKRPMGFAVV